MAKIDAAHNQCFAAARAVLERAIASRAFPGAAFGVLQDGKILALESVGQFTYETGSPSVRPDTMYDLASVSKVVATTAAAMQLYDRGMLDLNSRVGDLLPGFVVGMQPHSGKERVTLRMLLTHTSGMIGYAPLFRTHATPDALLRAILQLPLEAPPDTRTEYSDFGFILLGKIIEILAGEPLDAFWGAHICTPLGLTRSCFRPMLTQHPEIPPTEDDSTLRQRRIQGEVQDEHAFILGGVAGHAGLFSSVEDLLRFAACVLDEGRTPDGTPLFRAETVDLFARHHTPAGTRPRALGWDVPTTPSSSGHHFGPRSIGHLGYSGTSLWIDPDRSLAVVLLTNRTWPDRATDAIRQVRPEFHDAVVEALPVLF